MEVKVIGDDQKAVNDFDSLVKRTNKANPKPEDMQALQKYFDENPKMAINIGDLNRCVRNSIVETMCGESEFGRESAKRYITHMKAELGWESSSFVERMLIDEIVMRWARLTVMENDHKSATYRQHTFREGLYYEKRLHLAQARYLKAVETLAKVRKMIAITQAKGAEMFKNLMDSESKGVRE
jgi:hypothetical protein